MFAGRDGDGDVPVWARVHWCMLCILACARRIYAHVLVHAISHCSRCISFLTCSAQVFVNYPEPPASHDEDKVDEHLLDVAFFTNVQRILTPGGRITVVRANISCML